MVTFNYLFSSYICYHLLFGKTHAIMKFGSRWPTFAAFAQLQRKRKMPV